MQPNLFKWEETGQQIRLYAGDLSTKHALKMFDSNSPIQMVEFGGEPVNPSHSRWVSLHDLPSLRTVGDVVRFLEQEDEISLVDFTAVIDGRTKLSTHDDSEAEYVFFDRLQALSVLKLLLKEHGSSQLLQMIVKNNGKYVFFKDGQIKTFDSFENFLAENHP